MTYHCSLQAGLSVVEGAKGGLHSGMTVGVVGEASLGNGREHRLVERTEVEEGADRSRGRVD